MFFNFHRNSSQVREKQQGQVVSENSRVQMATKEEKKAIFDRRRREREGGLLIVTNLHYSLSETKNKQIL